jgi:hypothetical protein
MEEYGRAAFASPRSRIVAQRQVMRLPAWMAAAFSAIFFWTSWWCASVLPKLSRVST